MKYQLVIQFNEDLTGGLDRLISVEDKLIEHLSSSADVDGHDVGNGQMNIFILTDSPRETFQQIRRLFAKENELISQMKVAYRLLTEDVFICLWPENCRYFEVT